DLSSNTRLQTIWDRAAERLSGLDAIELSREMVEQLECPSCGRVERMLASVEKIAQEQALCPCGAERYPQFFHSVEAGAPLLDKTVGQLGLPAWDILWARRGNKYLGIELAGDRPDALSAG